MKLEAGNEKTAVCAHCGETTHTIWGFVSDERGARCAYFVNWGGDEHPPHVARGYGAWGEGTTADDRRSIYAELGDDGWEFVDHAAPGAPPTQEETFGRALRVGDVAQDPRRGEVMETLEFIVGTDDRIVF